MVPAQHVDVLVRYLQKCHNQAQLELHELNQITTSGISASLLLYQATKGWRTPTSTDWRRLIPMLRTKSPRKMRTNLTSLYLSPSFNEETIKKYDTPRAIRIFCKIPREFSFKELVTGSNKEQIKIKLSKTELELFEEMYQRKIVQI